jgi:hypothetical protein
MSTILYSRLMSIILGSGLPKNVVKETLLKILKEG